MLPRYRNILISLLVLFTLAFIGLVALFHDRSDAYAVGEAKKQALNALLVHRATHAYVTKTQRPEIYRLQGEGHLYPDYFSPKVMSFTYISRNIQHLLNKEREKHGLEPIYFKLASENPRNPLNQADANETALLRRMNARELSEYEQVVVEDGHKWLYLAVPIDRSNPGCMKCHGEPVDAPRELVALYGYRAGFQESANTIRALISIRVPLRGTIRAGDQMAQSLTMVTAVVLLAIYLVLAFLIRRIDVQERRILTQNTDLERLSMTDMLTGILNRYGLRQRSDEVMNRADRFGHPLSLLLLDLDLFKQINDQHGHSVGDEVLKRFSDTIHANLRGSDIFGRWGGEEFLVIAPHLGLQDAMKMAEKLRQAIENTPFDGGIRLTTSIGVSEYQSGETIAALLDRADRALYVAKAAGRNRTICEPAPATQA